MATGVSAHRELFERAARGGRAARALPPRDPLGLPAARASRPQLKERLAILFERDMSLAAYHLPLDAHPEVGNNALICEALGLERAEPFGEHRGRPIGFVGRAAERHPVRRAARALRPRLRAASRSSGTAGRRPCAASASSPAAARPTSGEAVAAGLDAFLTGEPAEPAMADAREGGVHFIAGGPLRHRDFGVRRLGELLAERFGVEHEFIEVPNPV